MRRTKDPSKLDALIITLADQLLGGPRKIGHSDPEGHGATVADAQFTDPEALESPLYYSRAWAQDLRGYKVICGYSSLGDEAEALSLPQVICGYSSLDRNHTPSMGQVRTFPLRRERSPLSHLNRNHTPSMGQVSTMDSAELLLRRQRADLARRTESRYRYDDTSVPLSEHGAIRGANSHRYPLTRREHWRAMDIDQHRALEREAHKMALATKAEQVAVASSALVALLGE